MKRPLYLCHLVTSSVRAISATKVIVSAITLPLLLASTLHAQSDKPEETPTTEQKTATISPLVEKTSADTYQIGLISLNKKTREIRLPAVTHITDSSSIVEYLLTRNNGEKIHETLLTTAASPLNINIALKLLSYPQSQSLFEEDTHPDEAAKIDIQVSHEGKVTPITNWLQHRDTSKPMPHTPWLYNGSITRNQQFMAELNGNILSIILEPSSLANYAGEDRHESNLWLPATRTPKAGTPVTVILKPWQ